MSTPEYRDKLGMVIRVGDMVVYNQKNGLGIGKVVAVGYKRETNTKPISAMPWEDRYQELAMARPTYFTVPQIKVAAIHLIHLDVPPDLYSVKVVTLKHPNHMMVCGGLPKQYTDVLERYKHV